MSYLRGPLSREQIRKLTAVPAATPPPVSTASTAPARAPQSQDDAPPVLPPGIQQFFVPRKAAAGTPRGAGEAATPPVYVPVVLGAARVSFTDAKLGIDHTRDVLYSVPITNDAVPVDWSLAVPLDLATGDLLDGPEHAGAPFAPLPPAGAQPRNYPAWEKAFGRWLGGAERLSLWRHPALKIVSRLGESERDFRIRAGLEGRAARDAGLERLQRKYASRRTTLADRLRRAEQAVGREQEQASHQKLDAAMSLGATVLGALFGRKALGTGTLGRATTAARGMRRTMKEASDVKRAGETVQALRDQLKALDEQIATEVAAAGAQFEAEVPLDALVLTPKRGQVSVQFVALGWMPQ
jgi:hypothetical protein